MKTFRNFIRESITNVVHNNKEYVYNHYSSRIYPKDDPSYTIEKGYTDYKPIMKKVKKQKDDDTSKEKRKISLFTKLKTFYSGKHITT